MILSNASKIYKHIADDIIQKKRARGDRVDEDYFPKSPDLREFGYRSFENAICDRKISLGKIRKHLEMSFENMIDVLKSGEQMNWNIYIGSKNKLDSLSSNEKEVYGEIILSNASKIYKHIAGDIIQKKRARGDKVDEDYFPKSPDLREFRYGTFEKAITDRGISIDDVCEKADFTNKPRNNWNIDIGSINKLESLNDDEKETYKELMLSNASKIFKRIVDDIIQKKRMRSDKVDDDYNPNIDDLREFR